MEPPTKPPIAVFQESFFCRRFALTLSAKAKDPPIAAAEHVSTPSITLSIPSISRTKSSRGPSKASQESHSSDILARESVLNGGHKSTGRSHGQGCADCICDGIFGVKGRFFL